ncbi:MAG: hypothetical protein R3E64_04640 [Halioglobus sp.]
MGPNNNSADTCAKDRIRIEITSHVQEFLHKGGRIEVLSEQPPSSSYTRYCGKPAAIDEMGLHSRDFE